VFESRQVRQPIIDKLNKLLAKGGENAPSASFLRTPLTTLIPTAKALFGQTGIDTAQRRWQAREISNVRPLLTYTSR
jgi:hypothetical protein